jgi:hypothetical protein
LLLARGYDEIAARQRRKACNEWVVSHHVVEVDVYRRRNGGGAGRDIDHLSAPGILKLLGILNQRKPRASFQDEQLVPSAARRFHDNCRAGHGDGHRARFDPATAGILGNTQENRAAIHLGITPGLVETEDRVCAESRDGKIGEGKFRARIGSGPHTGVVGYPIVHRRRARRCVRGQDLNVVHDLGDPRFLFRIGGNGAAGRD